MKKFFVLILIMLFIMPLKAGAVNARRESATYLFGGSTANYVKELNNTHGAVTIVMPDIFEIDLAGNIKVSPASKLDKNLVLQMHARDIDVVPFLSNHWDRDLGLAALANKDSLTSQLAENIYEYDYDGINVDIENLTHTSKAEFTEFIKLLKEKLPDRIVSVAVAANPKGWNTGWQGSYDYKGLADACDYIVIMAYDESYSGSEAGPVSSAAFFEESIKYAIKQRVPREKIIAGIPFYGRYWRQGDESGGNALTTRDIRYLEEHYECYGAYFIPEETCRDAVYIYSSDPKPTVWGGRTLGEGTYIIWFDNDLATEYKLNMVNDYNLAGVASWALGQEDTNIWEYFTPVLNGGENYEELSDYYSSDKKSLTWLWCTLGGLALIGIGSVSMIIYKKKKA